MTVLLPVLGAVLGFVPQMLCIIYFPWPFWNLAVIWLVLPLSWTVSSVNLGLSGKSFIPILIGTGCGVPGIMASRTIENERDRRMTIMTTTFIPCGAKLPFIAMIAGAIFGGAWWVAPSAYFIGIAAIIISGIMLKKTKPFAGDPAPFVMELPAYHLPTVGNVLRSMWERGWSFIKKAGTIILLSTILIWFVTYFGLYRRHLYHAFRRPNRQQYPCNHRKRHFMVVCSSWLGQLAGSGCFHYRSGCKRKYCWYDWVFCMVVQMLLSMQISQLPLLQYQRI